jgi:branched-chain amino acid transport system substrate-binding protein
VPPPITVGWIGAMTGPIAKYGAYQSARLAEAEINEAGGINGRPLKLIYEDGKGDPKTALSAAMKLVSSDAVKIVIGGHCTPESLAIAPFLERNKIIMLAAITSNPKLTTAGDYIFRLTPVSLRLAEITAPFLLTERRVKRMAILHEETDYARPVAEHLKKLLEAGGVQIAEFQNYNPGETDFRPILTRIRGKNPDAVYIGVQAQDTAVLILQQMHDLGMKFPIFANEIGGNAVSAAKGKEFLFEGLIYAEPNFDLTRPETKDFVERYKAMYRVDGLPMGFWSSESAARTSKRSRAVCMR